MKLAILLVYLMMPFCDSFPVVSNPKDVCVGIVFSSLGEPIAFTITKIESAFLSECRVSTRSQPENSMTR